MEIYSISFGILVNVNGERMETDTRKQYREGEGIHLDHG